MIPTMLYYVLITRKQLNYLSISMYMVDQYIGQQDHQI